MVENQQIDGIYGDHLFASGLLGVILPFIVLFNLELQIDLICFVGYVLTFTKLIGSLTILVTSLAIHKEKNSWICTSQASVVAYVKIFVLRILGISVCIVWETDDKNNENFSNELAKNMSIVFIILQMLFLTGCSRFIFYESRKMKYIMSFLVVVNLVNWLDTAILSSIIMIESNTTHHAQHSNLSCITMVHERTHFLNRELMLLPFDMEFGILATTILTGIPQTKYTGNSPSATIMNHRQDKLVTTCRHLSLSGKQRMSVAVVATLLNVPSLFYIFVYPTIYFDRILIGTNMNMWLLSFIAAKVIIFVLIAVAYYNLYNIVYIRREPIFPNFNDIALILGSSAVNASGVINFMSQIDPNPITITFHTWFNIVYVLYQTILILFLKNIVIREKYSPLLKRVKMIAIILLSYNILYWVKDSLFFLSFLEDTIQNKFIKSLFFLTYPFVSFYRFQSAMGLIPFLF